MGSISGGNHREGIEGDQLHKVRAEKESRSERAVGVVCVHGGQAMTVVFLGVNDWESLSSPTRRNSRFGQEEQVCRDL